MRSNLPTPVLLAKARRAGACGTSQDVLQAGRDGAGVLQLAMPGRWSALLWHVAVAALFVLLLLLVAAPLLQLAVSSIARFG